MNLHSIITIVSVVLFTISDCHLLPKKHVIRRQTQATYQNTNPMFQDFNLSQPSNVGRPPPPLYKATFPPVFTDFTPPNTVLPPGQAGIASENLRPESEGLASGNMAPESAGLVPENVASGYGGLISGNVNPGFSALPPGNLAQGQVGLASEKVASSNFVSALGNLLPSNPGLESGNAAPDNVEQEAGNTAPEYIGFAPANAAISANVPYEYGGYPSQNAAPPSRNFANSPNVGIPSISESPGYQDSNNENFPNPVFRNSISNRMPTLEAFQYSDKLKRWKKNAPYENDELDELLEQERKLFESSTGNNGTNERHNLKLVDDFVVEDLKASNATVIAIPKGVRVKTVTKQDNKKINSVANITFNTQSTLDLDNITEIENTLEMQIEKNIEDEKGANRGSEEVRIIETERVKPIIYKKFNGLIKSENKKSYKKLFLPHRRSKRSIIFSPERSRTKSMFEKVSIRFPRVVKKETRVMKRDNFPNRKISPNFKDGSRRKVVSSDIQIRDELLTNETEIDDFMKFFLKYMTKHIKYQDKNKKNVTVWLKELHNGDDTKYSTHETQTTRKQLKLVKRLNVLINPNWTWDIIKDSVKSRNTTENQNRQMINLKTTSASKSATQPIPQTLVYVGDRNESDIRTILFFLMITLMFMILTWYMRETMYKIGRLGGFISKLRANKSYYDGKCGEMKGIKYVRIENCGMDDYPQLEWQSEDGDWLIEKDTDLK